MDVQSDSADPASGEPQPSGKKKGFKLFGKRKPGSIFSIRGRGEEKDPAAAVARGKAPDGSPESAASDPEREPESAPEGPGENGPPDAFLQDEGMLMMAAAPPRPSICSTSSVRSLGFLLRLRGGRKGGRGERQVQTVSQPPPGRQRRGIKGLFSNVKFPANKSHQEDKVEVPPSPLLMPSRSNSVEIIKEDMTLTPRPPPRNHNSSSESEGLEPSSRGYGVAATAPRAPVSPGSAGSPAEPGDAGLSFLLADISSLLTFDSITTGGDIMADVAAEWDKASAAISARDIAETPAAATPSPRPVRSPAVLAGNPPRAFTASVKPAPAPSLFTKPAAEIKSSALSSQPFQSPPAVVSATPAAGAGAFITVRSSSAALRSAATPSSTLVTLTSFSTPPVMTSTLMTTKPPPYRVPAAEPTLPKPPAPAIKPPYAGPPTLSSAAARPTSGAAVPARDPVRADPTPLPFTPVAYGLPSTFAPSDKPESRNVPGSQSSSTTTQPPRVLSGVPTGEARASVLAPCPVQARPPSSAPVVVISKTPPLPATPLPPLPAPAMTVAKPPCPPTLVTSDRSALSSFVAPSVASGFSSAPTPVSSAKPPSIPAPVLAASQTTPAAKPAAAAAAVPARLDKTPSVPASAPLPASQAAVPALTLSSTPRPSDPASTAPTLAVKTPPLPVPPPFFTPAPITPTPSSVTPAPAPVSCLPASTAPTPSSVVTKPAPAAPTPVSIPVSLPKASPPTTAVAPGPGRAQAPAEPVPAGPAAVNDKGGQKPSRREEAVPSAAESQQTSLPGPVKDRRTPPSKLAGLSKIPIVGGGRAGKPPVRDIHPPAHCGDDVDRSPDPITPGPTPAPTPAPSPAATPEDERPRLSPQDGRGRVAPASRQPHHPEEQPQHLQPPRAAAAGSPRDSKIPVKHGAQPASQPREPPRSKIPTSKVPVRRLGASKPVAANATALQMRK